MDASPEQLQQIIQLAAANALNRLLGPDLAYLERARRMGAEEPLFTDGMYVDDEWCTFCLFDSDEHGFDDGSAGFSP